MISVESQPFSSCAIASAVITADCLRSGGYFSMARSILFSDSWFNMAGAAVRSWGCSCGFLPWLLPRGEIAEFVFPDDARDDFPRLDGDRLIHDAPLVGVVAHFDVSHDREILAERMTDEAVVGEDAPQVRVPGENDAEQVERLAFEPVGRRPYSRHRIDDGKIVVFAEAAQSKAP